MAHIVCNGFRRLMLCFLPRISERSRILPEWDELFSTALRRCTSLLWGQCVGVNLSVMHRKLRTQMRVRWRSIPTAQNWIQFPVSCGRDGGGTELAGAEKSPQRSELGFDCSTVLELLLSSSSRQPVAVPPVGGTML